MIKGNGNLKFRRGLPLLCGILLVPAGFADSYFVTSRDQGSGDLYQYSAAGAFVAKLNGNGLVNGQGVTIGPNGNLFVSNEAGSVLQYNAATGAFISVFVSGLNTPSGLIFGPDNNLYVGSNHVVNRFNGTTGASMGTFATGLNSVGGLAFGPNGNLFTTEGLTSQVKQFNGTTGAFLGVFATSPLLNNGAGSLLFYGGNLLVSQVFAPMGNMGGNSILKFDQSSGNYLGTFASDANLNGPAGLLAGPDGNLYVVNYVGANVVRYSPAGAFLGVFLNTAANGAQAPRFIAFANTSNGMTPTPAPASLTLSLLGIVSLTAWLWWRSRRSENNVHQI